MMAPPWKRNTFFLVRHRMSVSKEELGTTKQLLLYPGTLVCLKEVMKNSVGVIRVVDVDNIYKVSDDVEWVCHLAELIPITKEVWGLLQAVPDPRYRVTLLKEFGADVLSKIDVDDRVYLIDPIGERHKATVKYKGPIPVRGQGTYFGLDLDDTCEGDSDGSYKGRHYFTPHSKTSGMFATIDIIRPVSPASPGSQSCAHIAGNIVSRVAAKFEKKMSSSSPEELAPQSSRNCDNKSTWYIDVKNQVGKPLLAVGDKVVWVTDRDGTFDGVVQFYDRSSEKEKPKSMLDRMKSIPVHELVKAEDFYAKPEEPNRLEMVTEDFMKFDDNYLDTAGKRVAHDLMIAGITPYRNGLRAHVSPRENMSNFDIPLTVLEIEEKYAREYQLQEYLFNSESDESFYDTPARDDNLGIGSLVQVMVEGKPEYGVIRWIGTLPRSKGKYMAGIEMEHDSPNLGDGTFDGHKYFDCNPERSFFVELTQCRQDPRFLDCALSPYKNSEDFGNMESPTVVGSVAPLPGEDGLVPICGKNKGIQGHHNSCYLDATLFSMFTFTSVFDSLLFRPADSHDIPYYEEVQRVLREEIVNPLRKFHFVRADRVMKLRTLLEKLSSVSGLTTEEKDPEEFITSLVAQILRAEPFLKLSSGQEAYHYQLFVEKNENLTLPTVQQLFEQSFYSSDIKLTEVPSCLIIQMPRFGRSYKMYPRILPSQLLDVTDVIESSPRQCFVCAKLATNECRDCFNQPIAHDLEEGGLHCISFCDECVNRTHRHETRRHHKWRQLTILPSFKSLEYRQVPRLYMELFAVVCIETSHYVTFAKCGAGSDAPWCFFDSMADREGEQNGYNIPEVVPCPDLPHWLSESGSQELQQVEDRLLPEHAKRLLCDAYMCMYQSPEVMMYR